MKALAFAVSILSLVGGAAAAADMAVKAVAPPPMPSWAGFYIGGHGGYGWKDDPFSFTVTSLDPAAVVNGFKSRGWVGGGHFGYNWQYGAMVGGLELDVSATGIRGSSATAVAVTANGTFSEFVGHDVKLVGSARGRLGWAPNSDWLVYGTGGLGWERVDQSQFFGISQPQFGFFSTSLTSTPVDLFGWVLGTGIEGRLTGTNWIARLEYLHYDFGHTRQAGVGTTTSGGVTTNTIFSVGNQMIDVVRAGLSYKFGS
jgi:outer membrane immunogenic protein